MIFQMNARRSRAFEEMNCAFDMECFAETRVRITEERKTGGGGESSGLVGEFIEGQQTDIGHTGGRGKSATRKVNGLETQAFDEIGREGVECTGDGNRVCVPGVSKTPAWGRG